MTDFSSVYTLRSGGLENTQADDILNKNLEAHAHTNTSFSFAYDPQYEIRSNHQTKNNLDVYPVNRFSGQKNEVKMERRSTRDSGYTQSSRGSNSASPSERSFESSSRSTSGCSSGSTETWDKTLKEGPRITTAHGVSKITEPSPYRLRRFTWALLVMLGVGLFLVQAAQNTAYYLDRPVTVNVKVNYNSTLRFPAVTICNQNAFRLSRAVETGNYNILTEIFDGNLNDFNFTEHNVSKVILKDLYLDLAHQKEDLIVDCHWNHAKCSADDFESVLTDHGACVTFNNNRSSVPLSVSHTGADRGLRLQLNVEQYEYMKGPHNSAGLKILIHDQHEVPFVRDLGEAIPTGSTAFVGIQIMSRNFLANCEPYKVQNLKPPHGNCDDTQKLAYYDVYSSSACRSTCRTDHALRLCRCQDIYMPATGNSTDCTLEQYLKCIVPEIDLSSTSEDKCRCAVPCKSLHFQTTVTYSSASTMNVDSLLASPHAVGLSSRFRRAREVLHRSVPYIIAQDTKAILGVAQKWDKLQRQLKALQYMMQRTEATFTDLLEDVNWRASWHATWGLQRIKIAVERNYMRGWEVMDERTLAHVTTGFYQQSSLFRQMVQESLNNPDDETMRKLWWVMTDRDLMYRQEMAEKSSDNFTTLHLAYSSGQRIYNFRLTPIYKFFSFDEYYNKELLEFLQAKQDMKLYPKLHAYMVSYLEQIQILRQMARTLYVNGTIDLSAMESAIKVFEKRSRNYNYYRYMYRETVILKSQSVAQERIDYFSALNDTMQAHVDNLRLAISNIWDLLDDFRTNYNGRIADAVYLAQEYLMNQTIPKSSLAAIMTSKQMVDVLRGASTFFKNIHTRGQQLRDAWGHFRVSCERVWLTILRETSLRPHYEHIRRTVLKVLMPNETDFQETLMPMLAEMLGYTHAEILSENEDIIIRRTNADIATFNETLLLELLGVRFSQIKEDMGQFTQLIGSSESFLTETDSLLQRMTHFQAISTVDATFFKDNFLQLNVFMSDLSYEEIDQQIAYDSIALISDIGGSMGLFIGASIMTIFEVIDVIIHNVFLARSKAKTTSVT